MVLKYKNNSINKISSRKFTSPGEHYLAKSTLSTIMPNTCYHSYDLNFKLKIVAEAEAVNNNQEIAREYGISYLLEIIPITVIKKNCFGKIFADKTHPNFGGNF